MSTQPAVPMIRKRTAMNASKKPLFCFACTANMRIPAKTAIPRMNPANIAAITYHSLEEPTHFISALFCRITEKWIAKPVMAPAAIPPSFPFVESAT